MEKTTYISKLSSRIVPVHGVQNLWQHETAAGSITHAMLKEYPSLDIDQDTPQLIIHGGGGCLTTTPLEPKCVPRFRNWVTLAKADVARRIVARARNMGAHVGGSAPKVFTPGFSGWCYIQMLNGEVIAHALTRHAPTRHRNPKITVLASDILTCGDSRWFEYEPTTLNFELPELPLLRSWKARITDETQFLELQLCVLASGGFWFGGDCGVHSFEGISTSDPIRLFCNKGVLTWSGWAASGGLHDLPGMSPDDLITGYHGNQSMWFEDKTDKVSALPMKQTTTESEDTESHIRTLQNRIKELEAMLPWTEPGMGWFTLLKDSDPERLFLCSKNGTLPIADIGKGDRVFVGKAAKNE